MSPLQFQPLLSQPTPDFWTALTSLKLDKLKLDDSPQTITGWLEQGRTLVEHASSSSSSEDSHIIGIQGSLVLGGDAFGAAQESPLPACVPLFGTLKNFNTIEEFRQVDAKKKLYDQVVDSMISSFSTDNPALNPFLLVTFADLKRYVYHYWFAFPALITKPAWELMGGGMTSISEEDILELRTLDEAAIQRGGARNVAFLVKGPPGQRSVAPLSYFAGYFDGVPSEEITVAFHDPSCLLDNPGWPLRNVLHYLKEKHGVTRVSIICLRSGYASRQGVVTSPHSPPYEQVSAQPSTVGWERDKTGKLASRSADLGPIMDPSRLADQAVDLNLKLMKWRIMPSLKLDKIANTKCLLLGAGTLGCYVARALMGWGVRTITFVDSGTVSYSNPVRQPLFEFNDCLDGGKPKAVCAAESLRRIFPGVDATGHSFMIPMPGHPVHPSSESKVASDVETLHELIRTHDAVFLLMDSRESRWLPTVMGAAENKIVINAALGFDSYLVMRHGSCNTIVSKESEHIRLGCYFCNDVVAPADSLTDRSLDQMCTVTRPGLAPVASGLAVEMLISVLQHPLGISAPAEKSAFNGLAGPSQDQGGMISSPSGSIPHQLRGSLRDWRITPMTGTSYDRCTGCSLAVVDAFQRGAFSFLLQVFNEPTFLEKLTGLDVLHIESDLLSDSVVWEDSDGDDIS